MNAIVDEAVPQMEVFKQPLISSGAAITVTTYLLTCAKIYTSLRKGQVGHSGGGAAPKDRDVFLCPYKKQHAAAQNSSNNNNNNDEHEENADSDNNSDSEHNPPVPTTKALLVEFVTFAMSGSLLLSAHLITRFTFGEEEMEYALMLTTFYAAFSLHILLPLICFIYRPHIPRAIVTDVLNYQSNTIYPISD